ncbi:hypothetical protein [Vibrio campbellii]|uniref:hypothetical protein n=1 Tax=Vibrio campbellii TaxID=680 RepID=UPI0003923C41|nr:hypothetical protein [Vibrio campbellii]AGU98606.1 hypothetical protein M892_22850 [Vibrio campbellii ATCC BAA-1116]
MEKKIFRDVAIILAFGTGLLYVLGQTYHGAWLRTLGLSSTILAKDTTEMLQIGFAPFYTYGLWAIIAVFPLLYLLTFLAKQFFKLLVYLSRKKVPSCYIAEIDASESRDITTESASSGTYDYFDLFDFFVTGLFFVFLAALLYTVLGSWRADSVMSDIIERKSTVYELENRNFGIVTCSSVTSLCAIYDYGNETIEIIELSNLAGARIVSRRTNLPELIDQISSEMKM